MRIVVGAAAVYARCTWCFVHFAHLYLIMFRATAVFFRYPPTVHFAAQKCATIWWVLVAVNDIVSFSPCWRAIKLSCSVCTSHPNVGSSGRSSQQICPIQLLAVAATHTHTPIENFICDQCTMET